MKKRQRSTHYRAAARVPVPVLLANFLVFVAVFGLSYVWLCARCDMLGQEIKRLEKVQADAGRQMINEQDRWSSQLAPANLERALVRHNLAMTLPKDHQIVRVRGGAVLHSGSLAYRK